MPDPTPTGKSEIGTLQGAVYGGQTPVSGGEIFLFAAGTGGYGSAATSLLTSATGHKATAAPFANDYYVLTDAGGNFTISNDYTCTPGTQIYMVSYGGNSGFGANNPYIMQMAGLGSCPSAGTLASKVPYIMINEVSTVVFAYSMGAYGTSATLVGSPDTSQALTGISNAMLNVLNVMNIGNGQPLAVTNINPNSSVPYQKIMTLANILAACVNSDGALYEGNAYQNCDTLLKNTVGTSGTRGNVSSTGDEAQAIFYLVHNPTANISTLFPLAGKTPPFAGLSTAPTDWTLPVVYKNAVSTFVAAGGTTTSGPFNIAFDANGNAWIGDRARGVVEMSPQGAVSTYNQSFGMIKGVSVSSSGKIWAVDYAANGGNGAMYVMDTAGNVQSTITSGLNGPVAVAFDSSGNAFVANENGESISVYDQYGNILNNQIAIPNVDTPGYISVDVNGYAWIPSTDTAYVGELLPPGVRVNGKTTTTYTASSLQAAAGYEVIADAADNLWYGDYADSILGITTNTNTGNGKSETTTNSGLNGPYHLAIDGSGSIWASNEGAATVSEWNPTNNNGLGKWSIGGFTTGVATTNPVTGNVAATPDLSGNLWVANTDGSVTQILGVAAPTAAPVLPALVGTEP